MMTVFEFGQYPHIHLHLLSFLGCQRWCTFFSVVDIKIDSLTDRSPFPRCSFCCIFTSYSRLGRGVRRRRKSWRFDFGRSFLPPEAFGKFLIVLVALSIPSASAPGMYTLGTSFMTIAPIFQKVPRYIYPIFSEAMSVTLSSRSS